MANPAVRAMTPISACRGFTLLELLLVLGILAMAATLVVPSVSGLDNRRFDARVREATALLNGARRSAVVEGLPTSAVFAGSGAAASASPETPRVRRWTDDTIELGFREERDGESEPGERIEIVFYPEGGATGGTLVLRRDGRRAEIRIDPFSGRVRTERP